MSETLEAMVTTVDQQQLAERSLAQAKAQGVKLVGQWATQAVDERMC